MKKSNLITIAIIAAVIFIAYLALKEPSVDISQETAQCIADNSKLYVQLGCSHCETQKEMFGNYVELLDMTDCFYERQICQDVGIRATPTWIINGQKYEGVQSLENLKEFTGCQ